MPSQPYIGRFAPSPTGPMHFGTLIAAVASYLQAKTQQGKWLIRIEDVDNFRTVNGADKRILNSLQVFGFEWNDEVIYQTPRTALYAEALACLQKKQMLFPCTCSRKDLTSLAENQTSIIYPGTCRNNTFPANTEHSIRLTVDTKAITFNDAVMGEQVKNLNTDCGDFVIKRKDGLFAYQLAVVVDDALQGITEVVRGVDLLDSTARQIYLQQLLGYTTPTYLHLPLALDDNYNKLSKQTAATAIDDNNPVPVLIKTLSHLGQQPPDSLKNYSIKAFWTWAIAHWNIKKIPKGNRQA